MKKALFWINIISGAILLLLTVLAFFTTFDYRGSVYQGKLDANVGWFYADSEGKATEKAATLGDPQYDEKETAVLIKKVNAEGLAGGDLCFVSANVRFWIYLNDELIYDFDPEMRVYAGLAYGDEIHEVNIPYFNGDATIRIEIKRLTDGMWGGFERAYFQNSANYLKDIIHENLWKIILSFIVFVIGIMLILMALVFEYKTINQIETISIGVVAMLLAVWSNSGTYMLETFANDQGILRLLNYGTLIPLPVAGLSLVLCITRNLEAISIRIISVLAILNALIQTIGIGFGICDYHDVLIITHIVFLLTVIFAIAEVVSAFKKHRIVEQSQFRVLITFSVVVVTGLIDLTFYYLGDRRDVARVTRVGLVFFVVFLSVHEVGQLIEIGRKTSEAEIMKRLAHEDGLTKLENRLAFTEYETELAMRGDGRCLILQLDINFLKKVNDGYGHVEGDRIICGAADVIRESFGSAGRTFRTGGDEFIVILEGMDSGKLLETFEKEEKHFLELVEAFNQKEELPVPLSIAYGYAEYVCGSGSPEQQERLADARMYEHKKKLKAAMV